MKLQIQFIKPNSRLNLVNHRFKYLNESGSLWTVERINATLR